MGNKINNIILYSLIVFSIYCALTIGLSWDELDHTAEGNKRLNYLFSFGIFQRDLRLHIPQVYVYLISNMMNNLLIIYNRDHSV